LIDDSNGDHFDISKLSKEELEEAKETVGEPEFFKDLARELHTALNA
jgi:hypothetical protein